MKTRDISVGAFVEIAANRRMHRMYIRAIEDGKVTLTRGWKGQRGCWWLPYDYVRENGRLISPGEAGARPGDRE